MKKTIFKNLPEEKKNKIITAATEAFAENGYSSTSINSIVKKIGIAKGSIFNYFGDKKGLFIYIFNICIERVKDYLRQVREETNDKNIFSRLEAILMAGVKFAENHPHIYRLYIRMTITSDVPLKNDLQLAIRKYAHEFLFELLEEANEKNELNNNIDIGMAVFVIESIMDKFLQTKVIPYLDPGYGIFKSDINHASSLVKEIIMIIKTGLSS